MCFLGSLKNVVFELSCFSLPSLIRLSFPPITFFPPVLYILCSVPSFQWVWPKDCFRWLVLWVHGVQNVMGLPDFSADLLHLSAVGLCSLRGFSCCSQADALLVLCSLLRMCFYHNGLVAVSGVSLFACIWRFVRNTLSQFFYRCWLGFWLCYPTCSMCFLWGFLGKRLKMVSPSFHGWTVKGFRPSSSEVLCFPSRLLWLLSVSSLLRTVDVFSPHSVLCDVYKLGTKTSLPFNDHTFDHMFIWKCYIYSIKEDLRVELSSSFYKLSLRNSGAATF